MACGCVHPEQLAVLKADPMLIVVERDKASGQNDAARGNELAAQLDAERQKVSELTAQLKKSAGRSGN
ncbi:hypothetical protein [Escherichia coli]|uniref:hypothetical protein n=1 Tax=Escherichia coli TaxID=562 RepID=UPI0020223D25|nr:hypothetical protein [Escherichia coli]